MFFAATVNITSVIFYIIFIFQEKEMKFNCCATVKNIPFVLIDEFSTKLKRFGEPEGIDHISFIIKPMTNPEAYKLDISPEKAIVTADNERGLFWGRAGFDALNGRL